MEIKSNFFETFQNECTIYDVNGCGILFGEIFCPLRYKATKDKLKIREIRCF